MATSYWLPTVNMLPSLVELHLPSCRLTMLPLTLPSINFTSLLVLDLSKNKFTSTIPPWLFNLTELEMLDLTNNNLTGKLLDSLGYLKSLRYLDLSYNSFQGSIPKSIGNLTSLEEFDLAWNQMSGIILESLGEFSSLVSLDIYGNTWEGAITEPHFAKLGGLRRSMVSVTFLNHLNLSYNNLSGKIPTGNQFQTFVDPSIYEGNASLSRCPLPIGCQDNKEAPQIPSGDGGEDDDSKLEKLQFIISMVIGFCAGFWGVFRTFAMKRF
ncbi:probable LRR receptor-like serine/threonine-protein kinase At4g20940 [Prunus persica]|uniref:probable LRR receptor-like serine/threonine-protein kinase At4g20940 n=1 Tax=Prunus persica TaxID=3760 RepID=UPI0009AB3486|nr:probable LRR receptor-like serine/threonine-protein kinase At4g20940 [Prunus persica]